MSVNYFLYAKSHHKNIINLLEEITNIYDNILNDINNIDNYGLVDIKEYMDFVTNLKKINDSNIIENIKIYNLLNCRVSEVCDHKFITDTIDITPDRSQEIIYCTICEYTKE